jgi:hypothetical protein
MRETAITHLPDPSGFGSDSFTDMLRDGARKLIEQAIQAELAALMALFSGEKLEDGRARLVRHGHLPERKVMTVIGSPKKMAWPQKDTALKPLIRSMHFPSAKGVGRQHDRPPHPQHLKMVPIDLIEVLTPVLATNACIRKSLTISTPMVSSDR